MTEETLYDRIKRLSNVPIKHLEKELGLGDGIIQKWKKSKPSVDSFYLVARQLGVSMEYLLNGEDCSSQFSLAEQLSTSNLSTELANLAKDKDFINSAKLYNAVNTEYKKQICAYILGIATALGLNIQQILER